MQPLNRNKFFAFAILCLWLLPHCTPGTKKDILFRGLNSNETGIRFSNKLTPRPDFNMFLYMYFYNGAGVGAGDFNNDGLVDLFFASNQENNRIFLNEGKLHFKDVTSEAKIPQDSAWSTGVSVVDINNDGLLDIYVCRVGHFEVLRGKNQLLVCQGIDKNGVPFYKDEAADYGIDFSGFSTQAAFLDYDLDGDLDMYLLNHAVHQNGNYAPRKSFTGTYSELSGDRLFRNDGGHFTDVTRISGINSSAIGYGLGIAVSDINLDGYPDLYIGNDFHENDYLYINQKNGTFADEGNTHLMHTSQFSMGVDVADVNNDALPDIVSMDMLSSDPYILKRSLGGDSYDVFRFKLSYGYNYQYSRNNLQLNRGNGMFSETGLYSGIAATDWSWASLLMDFDNDGLKDLFVSNGIPKRLNDIDYVNFVSDEALQQKIRSYTVAEKDMALINKFPQIKIPNRFFRNTGNACFKDVAAEIDQNLPTYSNGAVYADFDNDGDLDIVVSNIDEPVLLYENNSNDLGAKRALELKIKGPAQNRNAVGARVLVYAGDSVRTYEKYPVRGFLSSMEIPLHIGLGTGKPDSMLLIWPDNHYQQIDLRDTALLREVSYAPGPNLFDFRELANRIKKAGRPVFDITQKTKLAYDHVENPFIEFDREPLIPFMVSREGPALAVADINGDHLEDVYIGSAKQGKSAVFLQETNGSFRRLSEPALEKDSMYEETDACWVDINQDGFPDLLTASGGNEYYGHDVHLQPNAYLNDGKGNLSRLPNAFDSIYATASSIAPCDVNGDGFIDVFLGGRAVPWDYGEVPRSYLLINDGKGHFRDMTQQLGPDLLKAGFVKQALWIDIDKDGDKDLLTALEWDGIVVFENNNGRFKKRTLSNAKGWWNFLLPCDIDNDGDMDLIAGNLGLNSRLTASPNEPVRMYYNDFDGNGKKEQLLTYYMGGKEIPFANKDDLQKQIPSLKKRFLYAGDFAKATLTDLFGKEKLEKAGLFTADYFANAVLINNGNFSFTIKPMPWAAQLSSYRDASVVNANNDSLPDILLAGNYYDNNIDMGRYDADFGTILLNRGGGNFSVEMLNGLVIKGQVRHIRPIHVGKQEAFVLARNNDSTMIISFDSSEH